MGLNYKGPKHIPSLSFSSEPISPTDLMLAKAEMDLIDTDEYFRKELGNSIDPEKYRHIAEIYVQEYDNHYQDISTILHIEGVLVEIYSDIFVFEQKNGPNEKSRQQKNRLLLLRNGIETLKRYFTKYDQLKMIHKQSCIERSNLMKENQELKKRLSDIEKAENF